MISSFVTFILCFKQAKGIDIIMEKKLAVVYPSIAPAPIVADLLSVLETTPTTNGWICNNFKQMVYIRDHLGIEYRSLGILIEQQPRDNNTIFSELPMLKFSKIKKEILNILCKSFVKFLENCIEQEHYIRVPLNQKFISSYNKNNDFMHPFFFYGYNNDKQIFYIADFHSGKKYTFSILSYKDVEEAYMNSIKSETTMTEYYDDVCLFRFDSNNIDIQIDPKQIYEKLSDFINCIDSTCKYKNSERWRNCSFFYGLDYFDELIKDISCRNANTRSIHVLADFYKINLITIHSLFTNHIITDESNYKDLSESYKNCYNTALIIRNKYLKNMILNDNNERITRYLMELKEMSSIATKKFLVTLGKICET